jgi:DNA-binding transcriptional ArsR family regulator
MADTLLTLDQLSAEQRKLLGHDLRYAIFMKLGERPRSATELESELGREFGVDVKEISRQVRMLAKARLVELASTPSGPKGGLLHKYRSHRYVFDRGEWEQMPASKRAAMSGRIVGTLSREIIAALTFGSFESHPNRVLGRRPLELDDEGAAKADAILTRADQELAEASAESLARGGDTRPWIGAVIAFPTAE